MLFILLAYKVSDTFALRYALVLIGVVQLLSIIVAKQILRGCAATKKLPVAVPELAGVPSVA